MHKPWYQYTELELRNFFDVDLLTGLESKDALARLAHFGRNQDAKLAEPVRRVLRTTVVRGTKKETIAIQQVVPGDIVFLKVGDRVPADIRLTQVNSLVIDQQAITGESSAIKNTFTIREQCEPNQQKCIAFAGSFVVSGSGQGVVVERGKKTLLAQSAHRRQTVRGLRGSVIARRLRRFGVIVLNRRALARFRKISTVFFDVTMSDAEIIDIIRKVQLTRRVECKFAVSDHQAKRLASELAATEYDAATRNGTLVDAQFITCLHTDIDNSLHVIGQLRTTGSGQLLWVSDGKEPALAMGVADISLVIGQAARDDITMRADLFAPHATPLLLTRILYNKK